ncbi:MAG TPA: SUMF1/EgtB/PvdO family nonheme iron enzyme [Planctomycetota bacterium]|nr:SUMF1/EgtB/PvdO family nonheme iron enzyme [Planctomycetota bacterium]
MFTTARVRLAFVLTACGPALWAWAGERPSATGTAFFVGKGGYLLTCAHVVKGAGRVEVSIGLKSLEAAVLAMDEELDLALLQVRVEGVATLPLANSNAVEVGTEVRAFGFPLSSVIGEDLKVTKGTISGISMRAAQKVLQVDAAVNPGNSGGPLVNEKGEVVGVVSAKIVDVKVSNVGFSVPINYAKPMLEKQGVEFGKEGAKEKLDGPALVKMVSPSVALVSVWPAVRVVDLGRGVKMEFIRIPAGSFMMGSEKGAQHEKPVHKVTIAKPFYMGKYEVTQEQWQAVMGNNPSRYKGPKNPVGLVSWHDCQAFVKKLNDRVKGARFTLPTDAEWEYACRAGSKTDFCFGDDEKQLGEYGWYKDNSQGEAPPVGGKKPNAWGLFDVHGNVNEWCEDVWHRDYEGAPSDGSAWLEGGEQSLRVLRGGSWVNNPSFCRSAFRLRLDPTDGNVGLGCRVVLRDF